MLGLGAVTVLVALGSAPAPSEPPAVSLRWDAPPGCPTEDSVRRGLARTLSDSAPDPEGLSARATVTEHDEGLRLELVLERPSGSVGTRTIDSTDCEALARTTVLLVALAIDPDAEVGELETPPEDTEPTDVPPAPEPEPPALLAPQTPVQVEPTSDAPPPVPPTEPEPDAPAPRRLSIGLRVQAAAGISVVSPITAVPSLVGTLGRDRWRVELGASYWTPVVVRAADGSGGRLQQWTVDARGCGVLGRGSVRWLPCGGLDVGATHGAGRGVVDPQRVASLRLALAGGAALLWRPRATAGRLGLWVGGDVLVALVRARFRASPAATALVYHTPPVGGRVGIGAEVRFR